MSPPSTPMFYKTIMNKKSCLKPAPLKRWPLINRNTGERKVFTQHPISFWASKFSGITLHVVFNIARENLAVSDPVIIPYKVKIVFLVPYMV